MSIDAVGMPGTKEYGDDYREACFLAWYQAARPRGKGIFKVIPKDGDRVPNLTLIARWKRIYGWDERADALDVEVRGQLEKIAITRKVEMLKRHAEIAQSMIEIGADFLENNPIDNPGYAIRLITEGTRIEKESTGGAQAMVEVARMSDKSLSDVVLQLMGRLESDAYEEDEEGLTAVEEDDDEDVIDGLVVEDSDEL